MDCESAVMRVLLPRKVRTVVVIPVDARFRAFVQERNPSVSPRTWSFIRSWSELAAHGGAALADSPIARHFVADREREHKRSQSRLRNRGLLGSWSGAAGSGALAFRWGAVRRILLDIHDGLDRTDA